MTLETFFVWIVIGGIAGTVAGIVAKSSGGLIFDIVVGIVGSVIGGWLVGVLNIPLPAGIVGTIIAATGGAIVLLVGLKMLRR
jgi:uncharacterized membrane protein YeaQ/YmgE (transglycosylase-associated protein family)